MSQIAITTSQNVNINFAVASIGERILAFILDWIFKAIFILIEMFIMFKYLHLGNYLDGLDQWSQMAILIMLNFPAFIYTLVLESLMEGQTFGKKIMKIRVVKIDGYQAGFGDYLIRWVFRLVDVYSNSGIVGLVSMIISNDNQRLGDIASGAAVISLKNKVNISHTILENLSTDYVPAFPQVVALSDNDMRIIKENFQKAVRIDDRTVIHRLTEKIAEIMKIEVDSQQFTERQFIEKVIKDYNFFTGKDS